MADEERSPTHDDAELVRRYQAGDIEACNVLLARHRDRLYRLALAWSYDPTNAQDIVQEVFARALKGLQAFRFRAEPYTWFYRTCRLVCHEYNRRRRYEPLVDEPAAKTTDPADDEQRRQTQQRLHAAMAGLSERQRDVVLLRVFEELSVRDTAITMGCREGTVKALLHKAKAALRRNMQS